MPQGSILSELEPYLDSLRSKDAVPEAITAFNNAYPDPDRRETFVDSVSRLYIQNERSADLLAKLIVDGLQMDWALHQALFRPGSFQEETNPVMRFLTAIGVQTHPDPFLRADAATLHWEMVRQFRQFAQATINTEDLSQLLMSQQQTGRRRRLHAIGLVSFALVGISVSSFYSKQLGQLWAVSSLFGLFAVYSQRAVVRRLIIRGLMLFAGSITRSLGHLPRSNTLQAALKSSA